MMTSGEDLYLENDLATGFIKYYEGGQYAFVVMLPKDKTQNAGDLIDKFTGESFDEYINSASQDYILTTKMPEFTSDWGGSIKEQLIALGMKAPFDRVAADFSGISECGEDLYIGDVIHKTHIEVDRNGTKAAATTAVVTYRNAAVVDQRERREVICDRPYAYAIVDTTDNTPVFIGTVNDVKE
jgi:serpin B